MKIEWHTSDCHHCPHWPNETSFMTFEDAAVHDRRLESFERLIKSIHANSLSHLFQYYFSACVIFVNWKYFPYSMSTHNRSQETILFFFEFEPNKKWELRTKKMQQKNFYVFGLARHGKNQTKLRLRRKKEFVLRQQSSLLPSMLCTRARLRLCGCTNGQLKRNKNNWETQTKANAAMRRWSPLQWKDHDVKDANNGCDCRI